MKISRFLTVTGWVAIITSLLISCEDAAPEESLKDPVDGIRIGWDYGTLTKIAPRPGRTPAYAGYARMIELQDGRLACIYETSEGYIELTYSQDMGETWTWPELIFSAENEIPPYVPSIIQLDNGTIIVACNPRPQPPYTPDRKFGIKVRRSADNGQSWLPEQLVYEAQSTFEDGCWEPALLQLPDGEVQLYFSNEGIYTSSNEQNISLLRSYDYGATWTEEPEIVGFRENKRDGMPVPLLLKDRGEILVSIEDNREGEFKPTIYREQLENNWEDGYITADDERREYHPLSEQLLRMTYAGGPYLARLNSGEVLLSYQTTLNRKNIWDRSAMAVEIGNTDGKLFSRRSVPFEVPVDKWGLWNSLAVIGDNVPLALTSTNAYTDGNTEVWMIKGRIIPEFEIPLGTPQIDAVFDDPCWQHSWPYFVGARTDIYLEATLCADEEYIFMAANLFRSEADPENGNLSAESVVLQIDTERKGYVAPQQGVFAFQLTPGNDITIREGNHGEWTIGKGKGAVLEVSESENAYHLELAIPIELLGSGISQSAWVGVNFELTVSDYQGNKYSESISSNHPDAPYSWCPAVFGVD